MSINGSPEEKLRWGFRIFDKDGSGLLWVCFDNYFENIDFKGSIELKEMVRIMASLLELEGVSRVEIVLA